MAFRLRVIAIEYDSFGETVLTGVLEAGQIGGGDAILVPTANGTPFQSVVVEVTNMGCLWHFASSGLILMSAVPW